MAEPARPIQQHAHAPLPSLSIVVPCYNEADNLPSMAGALFPVVSELAQRWSVQVILVDDGSIDDTRRCLEQMARERPGVLVVSHARNRGLGAAVRTGFAAAQGEVIVTTDSDGTYPFTEIPCILERLASEVDMVVASPYHRQGGVHGVAPYRLVLSQGASLIYRLLLDWQIHTYTSLFRVYRRDVVMHVPSRADGFLMPAEFLANAMLLGYRVVEFPTALHVRRHGQSKARVLRIILAHLQFQAVLLWRQLTRQASARKAGEEKQSTWPESSR
jgi:dolichol-phosphate mannosyltransferase